MKKIIRIITVFTVVSLLTFSLFGCAKKSTGSKKLVVGASPSPHAEILKQCQPILKEEGIDLEIKEFDDYVLPNKALDSKELDANFFQHKPYLDNFNQENGTKLVSVAAIHFEPLGIYSESNKDLSSIKDGAKISVPNDTTNEARALKLLEANSIIKLKDDAGFTATVNDITENPHHVNIVEMEAAQIPLSLKDVDYAVANGNYAIKSGILDKVITTESKDSESAQTYANILVVREGDENREEIQALVKALTSDTVRDYINNTYQGTVVPVF